MRFITAMIVRKVYRAPGPPPNVSGPKKEDVMKLLLALIIALVLPASAIAADASKEAADGAMSWLVLVDAGKYDQSWSEASKFFQQHVTATQWAAAVKSAREPLGALVSRPAPLVQLTKSLPGVPDGDYAIVQFHATFATRADALETVTMMMDGDAWKAAGYFIK